MAEKAAGHSPALKVPHVRLGSSWIREHLASPAFCEALPLYVTYATFRNYHTGLVWRRRSDLCDELNLSYKQLWIRTQTLKKLKLIETVSLGDARARIEGARIPRSGRGGKDDMLASLTMYANRPGRHPIYLMPDPLEGP